MQNVSAGRTHRSAPTADGKSGQKLLDTFCHFSAPYLAKAFSFYGNTEESINAPRCDTIVGADLCVRPWQTFHIHQTWTEPGPCFHQASAQVSPGLAGNPPGHSAWIKASTASSGVAQEVTKRTASRFSSTGAVSSKVKSASNLRICSLVRIGKTWLVGDWA